MAKRTERELNILINARDRASAVVRSLRDRLRMSLAPAFAGLQRVGTSAFSAIAAGARAALAPLLKVAAVVAPFIALAGAIRSVTQSLRDFGRQELATRQLATALELVGANSAEALPELVRFSQELQKQTTIEDEATQELMRYGLTLGVTVREIKGATQASIGLAEALGIDQMYAMRQVTRAREGDFSGLTRYIPALRTATTEAERMAIANQVASRGFELAKDRVNTFTGSMQQLSNIVGDFRERVGEQLAPIIMRIGESIRNVIPVLESWIDRFAQAVRTGSPLWQSFADMVRNTTLAIRAVITTAFSVVVNTLGQFGVAAADTSNTVQRAFDGINRVVVKVAEFIIRAFTAAETVILDWRKAHEMATLSAAVALVKFRDDVKTLFKNVRNLLLWMGDTWLRVHLDIFRGVGTVLTNMSKNLVQFFHFVRDWLTGKKGSFEWVSLTEGFETSLKKMPAILRREQSGLQRELQRQLDDVAMSVGESFTTRLNERLGRLTPGVVESIADLVNADVGKFQGIELSDDAKKRLEQGVKVNQAGLVEARFLTGVQQRSRTEKLQEQMVKEQKLSARELGNVRGIMQQVLRQLREGQPVIVGALT